MAPAYVLTEQRAEELGIVGAGPFTFPGFPGVYFPGQPLAAAELGLDEGEMDDLLDAAGDNAPLAKTTVAEGDGKAFRVNHAESQREAATARVEEAVEKKAGGSINSHAEADKVADELGISFPEGMKLAEKIEAINAVKAGGIGTNEPELDEGPDA